MSLGQMFHEIFWGKQPTGTTNPPPAPPVAPITPIPSPEPTGSTNPPAAPPATINLAAAEPQTAGPINGDYIADRPKGGILQRHPAAKTAADDNTAYSVTVLNYTFLDMGVLFVSPRVNAVKIALGSKPAPGEYRVDAHGRYEFNKEDSGREVKVYWMKNGIAKAKTFIVPSR